MPSSSLPSAALGKPPKGSAIWFISARAVVTSEGVGEARTTALRASTAPTLSPVRCRALASGRRTAARCGASSAARRSGPSAAAYCSDSRCAMPRR